MSTSAEGLLVLQEFRLDSIESTEAVTRIVEQASPAVPLLTSIDDPRDVATVRSIDADDLALALEERIALAPFVSAWKPARRYAVRVRENALAPPDYYRMAVTESGINDRDRSDTPRSADAGTGKGDPIGLLWIADPVGTHAGLLIVIGHYGQDPFQAGAEFSDWPLALSRDLGVRIYEGAGTTIESGGTLTASPHARQN